MRRSIKLTTLTLCMMALAINAKAETEIDYLQVAEDVDIMAKLIDKTLEEEFPDLYRSSTMFRESRGCQGIYLGGYGAVFITSIGFPVAERKAPEEEEATPDDLWQQARYELRGVSSIPVVRSGDEGYDPEKVGRLKERLLEVIGDYGSNIRQLGSGENIVIAVRGRSEPGRVAISPVRVEIKGFQEDLQKELKEQMKNMQKLQKELKEQLKGTEGPSSWIPYKLEEPADVIIQIYNPKGKLVRTLDLGRQEPGDYTEEEKAAHWDGKDDAGEKVAPGLYSYEVQAGDLTSTGKLILVEQPEPGATEPPVPPVVVAQPTRRVTMAGGPEPKVAVSTGQGPEVVEVDTTVPESVQHWIQMKDGAHKAVVAYTGAPFEGSVGGRTTLIIKVGKESIVGYKSGTSDFDEFAGQAEITQY